MKSYIKYQIAKLLILIFKILLKKNKLSSLVFFYFFDFIYQSVSYYLNLKTDLESLKKLSDLRKQILNFKEMNREVHLRKRIIFYLNISSNSLVNLGHIEKFCKKFDVFVFEPTKTKLDYQISKKFFRLNKKKFIKKNLKFKTLIQNNNINNLINEINLINSDYFIFDGGINSINLIDSINSKKIISINKTSTFFPHPKIDIQTYNQPAWPYKIKNNKIFNFKNNKFIQVPVTEKLFVYTKRNFQIKKNNKKNLILWYGNLKKLADRNFIYSISNILKKKPEFKFYFFGTNVFFLKYILKYFELNKVKNIKFLGEFNLKKKTHKKKLEKIFAKTFLMTNTFTMHGGRFAIEAYEAKIPIINFQLKDNQWKNLQKLMYYKNSHIFLKQTTASNSKNYENLILKTIEDKNFNKKIIKQQNKLLNYLTSKNKMYDEFINGGLNL